MAKDPRCEQADHSWYDREPTRTPKGQSQSRICTRLKGCRAERVRERPRTSPAGQPEQFGDWGDWRWRQT